MMRRRGGLSSLLSRQDLIAAMAAFYVMSSWAYLCLACSLHRQTAQSSVEPPFQPFFPAAVHPYPPPGWFG